MINHIKSERYKIPCREVTLFYSVDMMYNLEMNNVKSYSFHMNREEIFSKFMMLSKKERVTTAVMHILGLRSFSFDEKTKTFEIDSLPGMTMNSLSGGTAQALGVCTIILNPIVFGQDGALMVKYPEASLHPKSQSALGHLIAESYISQRKTFKDKVPQLFIESWSEHLINGIRIKMLEFKKEGKISNDSFIINFLKDGNPLSIFLDDKSEFSDYPKGFMDQASSDLMELLGIRK